ncbi:MAG: ThuA domain-containing protein [Cyclobacteriaceae bacterium]
MKHPLLFLLIPVCFLTLTFACSPVEEPPARVLVFSKTMGYRHASIPAGQAALMKIGEEQGFEVDTTEDASLFTERNLSQYRAVVFLSTTLDVLDPGQQVQFQRYIQAGGGFVGIHAAADTEYDWPWYGRLVGAYFKSHPNNPNVRKAKMQVKTSEHFAVAHLPETWEREDEWYNYKNLNHDVNVLISLDESSYEGGENGDHHAITWYHDFDGGRSFYTGLGHTAETFQDVDFVKLLAGGLQYAMGERYDIDYSRPTVMPLPERFTKVVLGSDFEEPMEMDLLPNGDILFIQRKGQIKRYDHTSGEIDLITTFPVHTVHEDGLLGLAVDPDFAFNNWIYLFYSPIGDEEIQRVSRFTYYGGAFLPESEKVLLEIPVQREECCHSAGSIEFDQSGNLFISLGDNTNPFESDGYGPIDERINRSAWDAQKSSSNTNDLRGKILRITPQPDGTYTIPEGNLFVDEELGRPEIYVMGCRNPFRYAYDDHTGYLYWGDVGPDAGTSSELRGPKGHDEVNQARQPGYFGWPYFNGNNKPYRDFNFTSRQSGAAFDPSAPVNDSPNNTGMEQLPPAQPAYIWYPYDRSEEYPTVGDGGRNAMAAGVYYADDYGSSPNKLPEYYDEKLIIYDWMRGWMKAVTMSEEGDYEYMEPFLDGMELNNVIDFVFSPNGEIYFLEYGTIWFSKNTDARLVKVDFNGGNSRPIANIEASQTEGGLPMTVQFSSEGSGDLESSELKYSWQFTKDEFSNEESPSFTFTEPGYYNVKLVVTDEAGMKSTDQIHIRVGNSKPAITWEISGNKTFFWNEGQLRYEVVVTDDEDGTTTDGSIDPALVNVSIEYLENGADLTEIAQGHQELAAQSAVLSGKGLMAESDCSACHQEKVKSIGPSYLQVAQKYKDDEGATDYLVAKIINGGAGVWGDQAMAAHPQLSSADTRKMVSYILSLSEEQESTTERLSVAGSYTIQSSSEEKGSFVLTASYTDRGNGYMPSTTTQSTLILRSPIIECETYQLSNNITTSKLTPVDYPTLSDEVVVIDGVAGKYIGFEDIDLSEIGDIELHMISGSALTNGGRIEVLLDNPEGEVIGSAEIAPVGDSFASASKSLNLKQTSGKHDLYIKFVGNEDGMVVLLDKIKFNRRSSTGA